MSFRGLVEGDCGGVNPLMQLGGHFQRDSAYKEEGFRNGGAPTAYKNTNNAGIQQEQMVNEFLGQMTAPPQTFRMDSLLDEMREIEHQNYQPSMSMMKAPNVFQEVTAAPGPSGDMASNYRHHIRTDSKNQIARHMPQTSHSYLTDREVGNSQMHHHHQHPAMMMPPPIAWPARKFINMQPAANNVTYDQEFFDVQHQANTLNTLQNSIKNVDNFFVESPTKTTEIENITDEWLEDFQKNKEEEADKIESYYDKFWSKLHNDWTDLAKLEEHPWLSQQHDFDPYKEYNFVENNPMAENENAFEKGKEFLKIGDIPSAVVCFEAAVKQEANAGNPLAWELLGTAQAENEMDPLAIAALKKSLDLQPDNLRVLLALSVSYTNESLQSQALGMLAKWLKAHPKYSHLMPPHLVNNSNNVDGGITSSLMGSSVLKEMQALFLDVVQKYPKTIDSDVQEALGILFNLSSEYDKAVDCFQAALYENPNNSKIWNRLGASLANGNRSVEAVEAYKRALELQPGFIRARYNVGIMCMDLKSYREAAEHLLTALNMQATSPSRSGLTNQSSKLGMSDEIWSTLRIVLALMQKDDLKTACCNKDLEFLNNAFQLE